MWQETSHNDQILNRFVTNQKMQIWMKYKSDSKKYCKSDVQKYKNISNKQSEREQILLTCVLILFSSCSCSCTFLTPGSGRWSPLFSQNNPIHHQAEVQCGETCVLQPRHHGYGRQLQQPLQDSLLLLLQYWGGYKEDWQQSGEGEGLSHPRPLGHQQPATLPQCPPDPNCVAVPDDHLGGGDHYESRRKSDPSFKPKTLPEAQRTQALLL